MTDSGYPIVRTSMGVAIQLPTGETLPIRHIIGIGMNYAAHAKEQGKGVPERPVLFTKNVMAAALSGDPIRVPKACQEREQVDFEAELGVVIGHAPGGGLVKDAAKADALDCVLGYVAANDVSARWWQKEGSGGQFYRGKSFDTFCPIGPVVRPAAMVGNPNALRIGCRVNGELMQDSTTADMIFDVATLVSEISRGHTLLPGTLIVTGTPSGVGMARMPPRFLRHGDVVEVTVEKVGTITNRVEFEF